MVQNAGMTWISNVGRILDREVLNFVSEPAFSLRVSTLLFSAFVSAPPTPTPTPTPHASPRCNADANAQVLTCLATMCSCAIIIIIIFLMMCMC